MLSPLVTQLIEALRSLPGIGPKSAQRMAFQLLEKQRDKGLQLTKILEQALTQVGHCKSCRMLCETALCTICSNTNRDHSMLCIVEMPSDVIAIEQTASFRGLYFVLMGRLSPLDGIGPNELNMSQLLQRIEQGAIKEVIIATNSTVEGEATAYYIAQMLKAKNLTCTRIAHGVPMGGELEYLDSNTLSRALAARLTITA